MKHNFEVDIEHSYIAEDYFVPFPGPKCLVFLSSNSTLSLYCHFDAEITVENMASLTETSPEQCSVAIMSH